MKSGHSVEKIGGTSMSAIAPVLANVLIGGRKGADLYNRIFVVSAYAGMTDLLLSSKKTGEPGVYAAFASGNEWSGALDKVRDRMCGQNAEMFSSFDCMTADAFVNSRISEMRDCLEDIDRLRTHGRLPYQEPLAAVREIVAGLGEAHSAHNTALLLRTHGVNAVFVDLTSWGQNGRKSLDAQIGEGLAGIDLSCQLPIVTGYAASEEGTLKTWGRGYSEVIFSRLAVLTAAREAVIHKEFHLSSADPRLVGPENARKIGRTNYDVADQLANLGMEAVHPGSFKGLRQAGISLRVRNTFDPNDAGTLFSGDYMPDMPCVEIVTGKSGLVALEVFEQDLADGPSFDSALLEVLAQHDVRIVSKSSNANTITHYLDVSAGVLARVAAELSARFPAAEVTSRQVAMVSVIGSDIGSLGIVARAAGALESARVRIVGMQHQMRNVDIQFLVAPEDFEKAVMALHDALIVRAASAAA